MGLHSYLHGVVPRVDLHDDRVVVLGQPVDRPQAVLVRGEVQVVAAVLVQVVGALERNLAGMGWLNVGGKLEEVHDL